ncbi:putative gustatory receptor 28b isoform X6 [Drosophila sulfurigaster albostrigata]|uniref:putative gustatory receptor 28b isoform X6 n=1 Tax=Drosophila sulfurigaster albostrigata TaxID=89887 RepID=UPI002D21D37E|nr:putative gustatory receptor 28b isoform X6 [Drosophila sulfurigaster albostrigata]
MWLSEYLVRLARPQNVYGCYRITFGLALFFGLVPYWVDSSERKLRLSWIGFVTIIVRICFYTLNFYNSYLERHALMDAVSLTNLSRLTTELEMFNGIFGINIVLVMSLLHRKQLVHLMSLFESLETEAFPRVGVNFKQQQAAYQINGLALFLLSTLSIFVGYASLKVIGLTHTIILYQAMISYFSPNFIICAVCILVGGLFIKLRIYISALNEVLKNLAHQWDTRSLKAVQKQRSLQCLDSFSMYTIVTKDPAEIIQESMEIHHLICEAAATANKYFTYQLLTIISIAFLIIVFDAYYVLETLLGKSKRESKFKTVEFVTFFSCQMILYLIAIISIVEGSNRAIKKSEKTGGIVHSLLNKTKSVEVREKLQQFSMQLMHLKINFTAAGLFNIDRTLYFTISGALTTYLIILLQFTSNSPNNDNGNGYECCEALHNMTNHTL